jgi:hypothetical protein
MQLGGPVWHASVSPHYPGARASQLFDIAQLALHGVGDAALGEWRESGDIAVHLRRRLTAAEMRYAGIREVCDIRGTEEFSLRIRNVRPYLPDAMLTLPEEAFP